MNFAKALVGAAMAAKINAGDCSFFQGLGCTDGK